MSLATATMVRVEEYLAHTYEPDCDFVAGVLEERNVGQKDHSKVQLRIAAWFLNRSQSLGVASFVEIRIRVSANRYRIPDVTVTRLPEPEEQVFTAPPYICIEILSPDDSFSKVQTQVHDYFLMGVENIWILDPQQKAAWICEGNSMHPVKGDSVSTLDGAVTIPLFDIFHG